MHLNASSLVTFILFAGSASACVASQHAENIDPENTGRDAREIKGGSLAKAYPEALLINMKQNGVTVAACSGSLIAPQVALTAGHCVYKFDGWQVVAPYATGANTSIAKAGGTLDWTNTSETVEPSMHDIGLIFLDTPIQIASYPELADSALVDGSQVVNIGRIGDGTLSDTDLYVSKPMTVSDAKDSGYPLDYMADETIESGDSGGPDMAHDTHTIVAVNSGAGGGIEVLARVDLVASWIKDQITSHGGAGTGVGGGGDAGAGGGSSGADHCSHSLCVTGAKLVPSCDPCVKAVCKKDSYCCHKKWDSQCVSELNDSCNDRCNP